MKFIRVHGRVIPIREHGQSDGHTKAAVAVGAVGAATSLNALNTTRVYEKGAMFVDKKKYVASIFHPTKLASQLKLHVDGKAVAVAHHHVAPEFGKNVHTIAWLRTSLNERGKGYANQLTKIAAKDIKGAGGKSVVSYALHEGSISTNYRPKFDTFFTKSGLDLHGLKFKEAIAGVKSEGAVWRKTELTGLHKLKFTPYRTTANKIAIGVGAAAVIGAAAYIYAHNRKDKR